MTAGLGARASLMGALALLVAGCAASQQDLLLSEADDRRVGEEASKQVAAELGLVEDPQLVAYLDRIGERLLLHAPPRPFAYSFQIVDQEAPNAFTLPGGFIYVSRGLLVLADSEDELANVIAHEIIHAAARHAASRQKAAVVTSPLALPGILIGAVLGETAGTLLTAPLLGIRAATVASYSRDQERAADREGQALVAQAGWDPAGLAHFLESLERATALESEGSRLPSFFDTHPSTPRRAAESRTRAEGMSWSRAPEIARARADFLARIDGLVVGDDPAGGVFHGRRFVHPDLDFSLEFPDGWERVNARQVVAALSPGGDAQVYLVAPTPGGDPKQAAEEFVQAQLEENPIEITGGQRFQIGPLSAYRIEGRARGPRGPVGLELSWIAQGGLVYRLSAVSSTRARAEDRALARNTVWSFRGLTGRERDAIRVTRLRVVGARAGERLDPLGRRSANEWDPERTAATNGLSAGSPLVAGQLVKVAVSEPYRSRR